MKQTITIQMHGVNIDLDVYRTESEPATNDTPALEGYTEVNKAYIGGVDVTKLLESNDEMWEQIVEAAQ